MFKICMERRYTKMAKPKINVEKFGMPEPMEYSVYLNNEKDKVKYVKRIEQIIRSSNEYRDFIVYLKDYVDMNHCAFFNAMSNEPGTKVRIEIHHDPLTLFDIVAIVVAKYEKEGIPLNDLYIAEEVLDLHYRNMVGLIPVSKSIHQAVHYGDDIVIPLQLIYGDWTKFLDEYSDYMDEDDPICESIISKLERRKNETRDIVNDIKNALEPKYTYIEVDGFELPKKVFVEGHEVA